jgi:hypothetical protein
MMYRNCRTGEEVPECLALQRALDECGIEIVDVNAPTFAAFAKEFKVWFFDCTDWDEIEDEDEEDDDDDVIDLDECNRKEWVDLMRERCCV